MMFRLPPAVKNLIIINVLMLIGMWVLQSSYNINLNNYLGLYFYKSEHFHWYQYLSYMFMHGGFMHLFFNMYALFMFGAILEQVWGSKRFLIFYIVTGIGAALCQTLVHYYQIIPMIADAGAFTNTPSPDLLQTFISKHINSPNKQVYDFITLWGDNVTNPAYVSHAIEMVNEAVTSTINIPTVGASGAVFGILLAFGMLFPNTELMLLFPPIPIKAKWFVIIYGVIELYLGISQPGSNVAHFAHLGGMLFGFILIKMWQKDAHNNYMK